MNYTVEMNYTASITLDVEASNEGEALDKAREIATEAPMNNFTLVEEQESRILNVG